MIAKYNGSVVESVRYLSGGAFNASIYDVIVDKSYQNHGIGYDHVCRMIKQLGQVSCVHLISTHAVEGLYQKLKGEYTD
ncbi:GNAT family N-acetyltransferase [Staphylococcus cohnii]|uniref:GNAT family N-acetyltransferase n=1 Tax=Staphylococcus cohnii TaxID=29382 RepID=UPI001CCF84A6|nr:GNAT family N-acetyltransferase [Staphylococcus cohnii]